MEKSLPDKGQWVGGKSVPRMKEAAAPLSSSPELAQAMQPAPQIAGSAC